MNAKQCLIYLRASTKDQDAERMRCELEAFATTHNLVSKVYVENISGTTLDRPQLELLLTESKEGDVLLVESVDRLSRLTQADFEKLKNKINQKGLKLIIHDLPTTHSLLDTNDSIANALLTPINNLLIDLMATMARLDNEKRIERIKQGLARAGYKPSGKKANTKKHDEIKRHLANGSLTKEEIAKLADVGVATVYRVAKSI